eukprot:926942-Prymnesium_polylepis.2
MLVLVAHSCFSDSQRPVWSSRVCSGDRFTQPARPWPDGRRDVRCVRRRGHRRNHTVCGRRTQAEGGVTPQGRGIFGICGRPSRQTRGDKDEKTWGCGTLDCRH